MRMDGEWREEERVEKRRCVCECLCSCIAARGRAAGVTGRMNGPRQASDHLSSSLVGVVRGAGSGCVPSPEDGKGAHPAAAAPACVFLRPLFTRACPASLTSLSSFYLPDASDGSVPVSVEVASPPPPPGGRVAMPKEKRERLGFFPSSLYARATRADQGPLCLGCVWGFLPVVRAPRRGVGSGRDGSRAHAKRERNNLSTRAGMEK